MTSNTNLPAVPLHEGIAELALEQGSEHFKSAIARLFEQDAIRTPAAMESSDDAVEYALANGITADQLATAIWGNAWTWDAVQASYARGADTFLKLWCEAGYAIADMGGGCSGVSTIVGGVEFIITSVDGNRVPNPDFSCLVGAYEPDTLDYLNIMQVFDNKLAAEQGLPALVEKAVE